MKGIILAGGSGTRLYPITLSTSKQLLSIYDKPMIYYPLSILLLGGIRDILIITTPRDENHFKDLLGDGNSLGINIEYKVQEKPKGIAEAILIGEDFIGSSSVCLILGDNIFYGDGLSELIEKSIQRTNNDKSTIFAYRVNDPKRYGIVEISNNGQAISIEEKPKNPKSNLAITGIYFYPNNVLKNIQKINYSDRGELEITDLNKTYLMQNQLYVEKLMRGYTWIDTGTFDSLLESANFISSIQKRQGLKIACIEEIVFRKKFIKKDQLLRLAKKYKNNEYGRYLKSLVVD
ncbi:MAG: glucose-1-phosphate thymidylyltransferase RfbA [Flavobacteriaceae bacterium]